MTSQEIQDALQRLTGIQRSFNDLVLLVQAALDADQGIVHLQQEQEGLRTSIKILREEHAILADELLEKEDGLRQFELQTQQRIDAMQESLRKAQEHHDGTMTELRGRRELEEEALAQTIAQSRAIAANYESQTMAAQEALSNAKAALRELVTRVG